MSGEPRSRAFALLGDPVAHSVSPAVHRAAFRALGLEATYEGRRVSVGELPQALRRFARSGGGNVTVPHKERVAALVEAPTRALRATEACNCFWLDSAGRLAGDNTDIEGFRAALEAWEEGAELADARVLLLGAGGAARAALRACLAGGASRVDILNRTPARARALAASLAPGDPRVGVAESLDELTPAYRLVVNATTLGLEPSDPLPLSLDTVRVEAAFDLVYGADGTPWTRSARALGIPSVDGLEMLVQQAALSLRRWYPAVSPPLGEMRRAALEALAGRAASPGSRPDRLVPEPE